MNTFPSKRCEKLPQERGRQGSEMKKSVDGCFIRRVE